MAKGQKILLFKCLLMIFPLSLREAGEIFHLSAIPPIPRGFLNESRLEYRGQHPGVNFFKSTEEWEKFTSYHKAFDVKELSKDLCKRNILTIQLILRELGLLIRPFKMDLSKIVSTPSLALKIFEKKFISNKISYNRDNTLNKFSKKSYFGGRCEVYGNLKNEENLYYFDFKGMYAQCMGGFFPVGQYNLDSNPKKIDKPGIYWIEYESKDMLIPVLPHHSTFSGELLFTNGKNTGAFWHEEILLFLDQGGVVYNIIYALTFDKFELTFKEYVDYFSKLRSESPWLNFFAKLMINSLYGRMGMGEIKTHSFVTNLGDFDRVVQKVDVEKIREINSVILIDATYNTRLINFLKLKKGLIKSNVLLASIISSRARIKLYKAQQGVLANGGRLLYSDTDSIFAAYNRNVRGERHGDVFWETGVEEATFLTPRTYSVRFEGEPLRLKIRGEGVGVEEGSALFKEIEQRFWREGRGVKRYFVNKFETKPYLYENLLYKKAD